MPCLGRSCPLRSSLPNNFDLGGMLETMKTALANYEQEMESGKHNDSAAAADAAADAAFSSTVTELYPGVSPNEMQAVLAEMKKDSEQVGQFLSQMSNFAQKNDADEGMLPPVDSLVAALRSTGTEVADKYDLDWDSLVRGPDEDELEYQQRLLADRQSLFIVLEAQRAIEHYLEAGKPLADQAQLRQIFEVAYAYRLATSPPFLVPVVNEKYMKQKLELFTSEEEVD